MKKGNILNISPDKPDFDALIIKNIEFIESVCFKTVHSKGYFPPAKISGENEAVELFNLVIDKLKKNNYKILRTFRGESKLSTYLSGIISFTYVDMIRSKKGRVGRSKVVKSSGQIEPSVNGTAVREGFFSEIGGEIIVIDASDDPESQLLDDEKKEIEEEAVRRLSRELEGEERLLLRMRFPYDEEVSPIPVKKISSILGISEKAVYKRISKTLEKCRNILKESGISGDDFFREKK